jgi:hypothetical protein
MEMPTVPAVRCLVLRRRELNRNLLFWQVEVLEMSNAGTGPPASSSQKQWAVSLSAYRFLIAREPRGPPILWCLGQGCLLTCCGFKQSFNLKTRTLKYQPTGTESPTCYRLGHLDTANYRHTLSYNSFAEPLTPTTSNCNGSL